MAEFRIAIVGSGAIGGYYGAKLAQAGREVHFLMRSDLTVVRRNGIRVHGGGEDFHLAQVSAYKTASGIGPCDLILIALKTTSNSCLTSLIPPLLREETMLLTLQNGLGNEEFLAANFGAKRVLGGLCFVCLNRVAAGVIEHYDHGRVAIGEFSGKPKDRTRAIVGEFKESGVRCRVAENLALERWRKLVWNIPFNGLSVVSGGIDNAKILADKNLRTRVRELMDETIRAANACGLPLEKSEADEQIRRTDAMGAYKPSTLIDFEDGKPLELEAIWGEPLRRAKIAGAEMPRLEEMYAQLKLLAK